MTIREHAVGGVADEAPAASPELLVVVATPEDAAALAPLGRHV